MKNLDYKKIAEEVDEMIDIQLLSEMELLRLPSSSDYTQEKASKMSKILGKIYSIAHSIHCEACQSKYVIKP